METSFGEFLKTKRQEKNLTQKELANLVFVSESAVSKWERGESLPEVSILMDLANILETSVDHILRGGEMMMNYKGKITVSDMREGIHSLKRCGELLGKDNLIYRSAIEGINTKMNTDIEMAFTNDHIMEVFVTEAIIQNLQAGAYIDLSDVKNNILEEKYKNIILEFASKYNIK